MNDSSSKPKRYIIWILGALSSVSPFAIDMYLPSFTKIAEEFHTTTAKVSWSISSYFIGLAVGQMLYGPLLDRFGRKRPLYIGLVAFVVASIAATQASNTEMLIAIRFVQAVGGCVAWVGATAMVRDFFPVEQSARVFSLLVLILGASPLLAPTLGGFIATAYGWQTVFVILAAMVSVMLLVCFFFLPEGHRPDPTISLAAGPMIKTFQSILTTPQFFTYCFAGALSFSTLFVYVAGSPVIFMEIFHVSPKTYGILFAVLSIGFIGGSQVNILINKRVPSEKIFKTALSVQLILSILFLTGTWMGWLGLLPTFCFFFALLICVGFVNPNAQALALAPFTRNVGSASALLGCTQIGIAALTSSGVGFFNSNKILPIVALMTTTTILAVVILLVGLTRMKNVVTAKADGKTAAH